MLLSGLVARALLESLPDSLTTDRLVLARIGQADVGEVVEMVLNPALYTYIDSDYETAEQARQRVGRWVRGSVDPEVLWVNYVARTRADQRFVGLAQATVSLDHRIRVRECTLAYMVDPPQQRQGFGAEMMTEFWPALRRALHPEVVTAHIYPGHTASERVVQHLGLELTDETVDGERVWRAGVLPDPPLRMV